jgi:phosphoribosylanthranilate isomerase
MKVAGRLRVKVCCIQSVDEAWMAIDARASALGFVAEMPSGPGVIPEELIAEIVRQVPPPIATFLLTSRRDVPGIIAQQRRTRVNTLQLCDRLPYGTHARTGLAGPSASRVREIGTGTLPRRQKRLSVPFRGWSWRDLAAG